MSTKLFLRMVTVCPELVFALYTARLRGYR